MRHVAILRPRQGGKRKLAKELRQLGDKPRLLDLEGKRNTWGLSLNMQDDEGGRRFQAFGHALRKGDVIDHCLESGNLAVVTEVRRPMSVDDMTLGSWEPLSAEASAVVRAMDLPAVRIIGLL